MDKETLAIQREGQMIEDFTKSEGWNWIKGQLISKIMDLQSIRNLDENPESILLDVKARNTAVDILEEVIKDVEGIASQHSNNKAQIYVQEEIIIYPNGE